MEDVVVTATLIPVLPPAGRSELHRRNACLDI